MNNTFDIDFINEEIKTTQEQLEIDIKKVSLLQQEIKDIQQQAQTVINEKQAQINTATQPIIENQGSLKKLKELKDKLEGKIKATTDK
tara:strand:+ start:249 stop:512 length:264 start_codon:yes stop_codon:yes gene_type:complete